ncbi:hypothetical protein SDJN02_26362, partial [Cucurbita argyrosperma subsp. argyrosperma]
MDKEEGLLNLILSNELFSLFLDDTMMYSCAIFKVRIANFCLYNLIIYMMMFCICIVFLIKREDEDLRIAQLRKTRINKKHKVLDIGCGWGTLAIEIVKQTRCHCTGITEMIEAVGHEFMEDFFGSCESVLEENGLLNNNGHGFCIKALVNNSFMFFIFNNNY